VLRVARAALAAIAVLAMGGCSSQGQEQNGEPPPAAAAPDLPHFQGRLAVELVPALQVVTDARCAPDPGAHLVCSPDHRHTYRMLSPVTDAELVEARMDPSADHTSWTTTVRFEPTSRAVVDRVGERVAAVGGVALLSSGDRVLAVLSPDQVGRGRVAFEGLARRDAWDLVEAFTRV
jgi:hypothetical protein